VLWHGGNQHHSPHPQSGVTRAGGFTELLRIAEMCALAGVQCIPHGWMGGIGSMCQLHLQPASPAMPYVEYLHLAPFASAIRREVTRLEPLLQNSHYALPPVPGLGLELCEDALAQFRPIV
jgi:L-alanine-DL-glutamate epimerase-like enolase superfamily enzyme